MKEHRSRGENRYLKILSDSAVNCQQIENQKYIIEVEKVIVTAIIDREMVAFIRDKDNRVWRLSQNDGISPLQISSGMKIEVDVEINHQVKITKLDEII
ncbi:MAG: hypothetical protein ABH887_01695 [bacterium]